MGVGEVEGEIEGVERGEGEQEPARFDVEGAGGYDRVGLRTKRENRVCEKRWEEDGKKTKRERERMMIVMVVMVVGGS